MSKTLLYETRDANGQDIIKEVLLKELPIRSCPIVCPVCHESHQRGVEVKKAVSSNFTDWALVGEMVCERCAKLFNLYPYSYVVSGDDIKLLNVRQIRDALLGKINPPFLFVITTTQKKHLFYRAKWNYTADPFSVNLETEPITTSRNRMKVLFDFVECLQTLGQSKGGLLAREIRYEILQKIGKEALLWLNRELDTSREIQIPLFCGQKRDITEEEAICTITSILKA